MVCLLKDVIATSPEARYKHPVDVIDVADDSLGANTLSEVLGELMDAEAAAEATEAVEGRNCSKPSQSQASVKGPT